MESRIIRQKFLDYFKDKQHKIVPSAPIVVKNDPTLMFTNAGMNQFKDYFLGNEVAANKRIVDTQKCLRVSGKHNDLEEVGFDTYHHTMFEMLGNWSFGDYFKKEAISWAWELLTVIYKLPEERMYVTVFEGDQKEKLVSDNESRELWLTHVPIDRIINGNKKDNFWEMGDSGPCGPCSEVHIDLRSEKERSKIPGRDLVNCDHPQVVEIWNLVFIQFNRLASGELESLPEKHVDTGMGFERLAMAIQGKQSNYDTDVFQPLIKNIAQRAGTSYGSNEKTDVAIRVIADHIRAIAFTIADGQLPSNAKAGYVIRRILRRAVRYGYTFLGFNQPFLFELIPMLSEQFSQTFPELSAQQDFVTKVIKEEELAFLRTLEKGLARFDLLKTNASSMISGLEAFELFDTYGFPLDLTALIAKEHHLQLDMDGFEKEMSKQKDRSKKAAVQDTGDWNKVHRVYEESVFVGYDQLAHDCKIVRWREVKQKEQILFQLVLDYTPFYAESGGQTGDTGVLISDNEQVIIHDTKKENALFVHITKKLPQQIAGSFKAVVDKKKRSLTENNHSATHLLHAALREVLGDHVQQRGSLVNEHLLRFDFSHFVKLTTEEIIAIERIVNQKIRSNIPLEEVREVPISVAKKMGAMALFGEKYGDSVRVIIFDKKYSIELCGGTHVSATGEIGMFKILSESSVATGVRRIEAITADRAETFYYEKINLLNEIEQILKNPKDPLKALASLLEEKNQLSKQVDALNRSKSKELKKDLLAAMVNYGDINLISFQGEFPSNDSVKQISFELKKEVSNLVLLIGAEIEGKPNLTVMIDEIVTQEKSLNANELIKGMASFIQGGGGGQSFYATAGGKKMAGLSKALEAGKEMLQAKLQ
jgi:alanyl-tRNA synthetase